MIIRGLSLATAILLTAGGAGAQAVPPSSSVDSIVLDRSGFCFGTCPDSRLVIGADRRVDFLWRDSGATARSDSAITAGALARIVREAARAGFDSLPARPGCRVMATDLPTIAVGIYTAASAKWVSYNLGCVSHAMNDDAAVRRVVALRQLADTIDAVVGEMRGGRRDSIPRR